MLQRLVNLAERGRIPDRLLVAAMWFVCLRRRSTARRALADGRQTEFVSACRNGPIAIETDAANEQHYEVPPEFFHLVLGPRLKYSCALYPTGRETLAQAEEAMLELTCARAGIADGMRVLDLGCGWGSLSMWIAQRYPDCTIVAMSNSTAQRLDIERRCRAQGIDNVEVVTADIVDFEPDGTFDRIVSVEMMEHVRNHAELFRRISGWMAPDGKLFVHVFVNRDLCYPFEDRGEADWMSRWFFTGGMMPSWDLLPDLGVLRLERRWKVSGTQYARTLRDWLAQQDGAGGRVMEVLESTYGADADVWFQRWRMFFLACATLFDFGHGDEWFVAHYLFTHDAP